jgi:hypothetical protein
MPFKPYRSSLDPETLQAAYEAFDLGWAAISKAQDEQQQAIDTVLWPVFVIRLRLRGNRGGKQACGCWYAAVGITKTLKGSTNSWTSLRNASPLTP